MANETLSQVFSWHTSIVSTYQELSRYFIAYIPQVLGAILLLVVGWTVAKILFVLTRKLLFSFDILLSHTFRVARASKTLRYSYVSIISNGVFWIVILFFIAASVHTLGWSLFSGWMEGLINYLPSLITGILIILVGCLLSYVCYPLLVRTIKTTSAESAALLARATQSFIIITAIIVSLEQIGIHISFLSTILIVGFGILLAGAALSFSLGVRPLITNMISAQFGTKLYNVGDYIKVLEHEGEIVAITKCSVVIDCEQSRIVVPAKLFFEEVVHIKQLEGNNENDGLS